MSCSEFSGIHQNGLPVNDFAMCFKIFEVGSVLSVSAFKDRAKKYATRHVPGTVGDMAEAKAGPMFDVEVVWLEEIDPVNTRREFPRAILKTTDNDYITCLIDKDGHSSGLQNLAWAMIISPLELVQPHVNTWMQTWKSPVTVVDSTLESALR